MMTPSIQTRKRRMIDLLHPKVIDVDFRGDVAFALAHLARFTGHAGGYSVAQHSVIACDVAYEETSRPDIALYALLHDAHEAYLGDISTPMASAIAEAAMIVGAPEALDHAAISELDEVFRRALRLLKARHDAVIHAAANLPWPMSRNDNAYIHELDIRLVKAERGALLRGAVVPWAPEVEAAKPISGGLGRFFPWTAERAMHSFIDRVEALKPIEFTKVGVQNVHK